MKTYLIHYSVLPLLAGLAGCNKEETKPLSERIRQVWTINVAKENSIVVYAKTGTSNNKPGTVLISYSYNSWASSMAMFTPLVCIG